MNATARESDPYDVRRVRGAWGLLRDFNQAGVLSTADVHVARALCELAGERDETVLLAAALAVRAPRVGHVYVDLERIRDVATVEAEEPLDLAALPWPDPAAWPQRVAASELVAFGDEDDEDAARPLRLVGAGLYLDRYWREERLVAADLIARSAWGEAGAGAADGADAPATDRRGDAPGDLDLDLLAEGLARLFAHDRASRQCQAAAAAVLHHLAVVAGGPGTGKTTTVARIVALLAEQATARDRPPPLVALAAPTGRAAARLAEAVHEQALTLPVSDAIRAQLLSLEAVTLHRLLGWRPDSHSRFRHDRRQRLAHDVVIVDETSMVSMSLMARLLDATRPDARVVLVGDPAQLASIEAGAVLGDIVGPATAGPTMTEAARAVLARVTGHEVVAAAAPSRVRVGDGIVVLDRVHRYGGTIGALAGAIRSGDPDAVLEVLAARHPEVTWIAPADGDEAVLPAGDGAGAGDAALAPVRASDVTLAPVRANDVTLAPVRASDVTLAPIRVGAVACARAVIEAAQAGAAADALEALGTFRILCAHRRGPDGVASWTARVQAWLAGEIDGFAADARWYAGQPLLVTENDYELRLYNGDSGVVVADGPDRVSAVFERGGDVVAYSPLRLGPVQTLYAMTVHKSQGSQFDTAAVVLPGPDSRILTRELLYTAATRARRHLVLLGSEEAIRAAVLRPVSRASGLRGRLWGRAAG